MEVNLSTDRLLDGDDCCRAARRRADAVGWLRSLFPDLPLPPEATDEDLRAVVGNGRLLCALLRRLFPGALLDDAATDNVGRFRAAIQRMGVPTFSAYDLERVSSLLVRHGIKLFSFFIDVAGNSSIVRPSVQGEMSAVITCILALKDRFPSRLGEDHGSSPFLTRCDSEGSRRSMGGKLQRVLTSPIVSGINNALFG